MAYRDDYSPDCRRWSNQKLIDRIREVTSMQRFAPDGDKLKAVAEQHAKDGNGGMFPSEATAEKFRDVVKHYHTSWLEPLLNEMESRMVKPKKKKCGEE